LLLLPLVLGCFALSPRAHAVNPAPDGGYPNGNTAEGEDALFSLTTGVWNTGLGFQALYHDTNGNFNTASGARALFSNTTGLQNTASGASALYANTAGLYNTATGVNALRFNTTASSNTAIGVNALRNNNGPYNTATGVNALRSNTTGSRNTANGAGALEDNTTGNANTANGVNALRSNTTGNFNTANGVYALEDNTTGIHNTANGYQALVSTTAGSGNTANGVASLLHNTTGNGNTANGVNALVSNTTGFNNTANGINALINNTTGNNNIALGVNAGFNVNPGSNNIDIANNGVAGESGTIRIGSGTHTRTFIAAIRGVTTGNANAVNVVIDSAGQLGTMSSSRRFKHEIKPIDGASEAILALKPVAFHYKNDSTGTSQFGLIAEEVAEVNPDLVVRDENGEIYTVRYDAVNAMLLNEFLKEHRRTQQQEAIIAELESTLAKQQKGLQAVTARLGEQAAQIQNVSAQIKLSKFATGRFRRGGPAPQVVLNNP